MKVEVVTIGTELILGATLDSNGAELGRALGISESNAGTRLHRALTSLREACQTLGHQEVA